MDVTNDELRAFLGIQNWLSFWHCASRFEPRYSLLRVDTATMRVEHFVIARQLKDNMYHGRWEEALTGSIIYDILQDRYGS